MDEIKLVTKYFPFMDSSQQEFLRGLFVGAEDFDDYVKKLVDAVCTNEDLVNLVPFACSCIWILGSVPYLTKLVEVLDERATSLPWYIHAMYNFGQIPDGNLAVESIRKSMDSVSEDWILFESRLMEAIILGDINTNEAFRLLSELEQEIKMDSRFEIFTPFISYLRGAAYETNDDIENAIHYYTKGMELAVQHGDWFIEASCLLMLAKSVNNHNLALKYSDDCRIAFHRFSNTLFDTSLENNEGFYHVAKGDYDKAIEHYLKSIELTERNRFKIHQPYLNIAVLYGNIGQPEKALEYSKKALEIARDTDPNTPATQIEMARALVLSNRIEEAFEYLEAGGELAFKSGSKKELSRYYLVKGMLEMARNNYTSAISTLNRGLRIAETRGAIYYILQILLQLAGAEILIYAQQEEEEQTGPPSLALARLEQLAQEQQLIGLSVQVIILKAEIDMLQNEQTRARKRLEEALVICEKEGLQSLRSKIESRIAEINTPKTRKSLIERFKRLIHQIAVPSGQTRKTPFVVMGCIMILRDAGLEVYSEYTDPKITSDPSLVAGLISAVSAFARELREDTTGNLQSIIHQDIAVLLEHGTFVTCALLANRDTFEARLIERRFLEKFEDIFSDSLKQFQDGMVQPLNGTSIYESVVIQRNLED